MQPLFHSFWLLGRLFHHGKRCKSGCYLSSHSCVPHKRLGLSLLSIRGNKCPRSFSANSSYNAHLYIDILLAHKLALYAGIFLLTRLQVQGTGY